MNKAEIEKLTDAFLHALLNKEETNALKILDQLIELGGKDFFSWASFSIPADFTIIANGKEQQINFKIGWLHCAVQNNFIALAKRLLHCNFPVDEESICQMDSRYHGLTPLIFACLDENKEFIDILIAHGADLMRTNGRRAHSLMYTNSIEIFDHLLLIAKQKNCLQKFLAFESDNGYNICEQIDHSQHPKFFAHVCRKFIENNCGIKRNMLARARDAYWFHPELSQDFEAICAAFKQRLPKNDRILEYSQDCTIFSPSTAFDALFFEESYSTPPSNKEEAIKKSIAEVYALLSSPQKCEKYLQFLNKEYARYFHETHGCALPKLDKDTYSFQLIDGIYFPIPHDQFIGIKKKSSLQEFLIAFFRKNGLAAEARKWIGFLPHEIANEMVIRNDFIVEGILGPGLFHNKLSHMLQLALIICGIHDNVINLIYEINGEKLELSLGDVSTALVTILDRDQAILWIAVRDKYTTDIISFSNPHRLSSVIMHNSDELALDALSTSLIDSFCSGIRKLLKAYQQAGFKNLDMQGLVKKSDELLLGAFNTPLYLLKHSLFPEKNSLKTRSEEYEIRSEEYGVVKKHYSPNPKFTPRNFSR